MKLLERAKSNIIDKNGENVPYLDINEVILIHCNVVKDRYQQNSRVLYTIVPKKLHGHLLDILLDICF